MQYPFKLETDREFDVVGFGTNAVDYLIQVPKYPRFDSKIEFDDYIRAAGGEVATAMVALQRLGLKTSYIGRFGNDSAGDFGLKDLRKEGVDVDQSEQIEGARTQIAFIIIDQRNGERTVIWKRDELIHFGENDVPAGIAKMGKLLHLTPHDTKACLKAAGMAKSENTIVSIDIDNVFDGINELLPLVDVLISSADFPEKLLGIKDKKDALLDLKSRFGCGVIGLTLGAMGSLIYSDGQFIETVGFAVPGGCKDTTGAGDSFRAGFLYGLLKGETVEESAKMANGVAALKCREIGARTALPNHIELREFLRRSK